VEANEIDVFTAPVFGNLQKIEHAEEARRACQFRRDIGEADLFYGIDVDLACPIERIMIAGLHVRPLPDPNAARDFAAADSIS